MNNSKTASMQLANHFRLSNNQSSKTEKERNLMANISHASAIGSLVYVIFYARVDIAHAMGDVSRFMTNLGKKHWEAIKWKLRYLQCITDQICTSKEGS